MRIGIIGAGAIAQHHLGILAGRDDVEVGAVADVHRERAEHAASAARARAYASWEAMLEEEPLDAVFVCTPPRSHAAPAVAALGKGLAVYLEKPLARSRADGIEIVSAWESSGAVCAVGYQWRSLELLADLRAALAGNPPGMLVSRSFGPTEEARGDLAATAPGSSLTWFADPVESGGILFELGSHDVDLQLAIAGPVAAVQASAARGNLALAGFRSSALHDAVALLLHFRNGALGAIHVAWTAAAARPVYALDVVGQDATLHLVLDPEFRLSGTAGGRIVEAAGSTDLRRASVERFLAAARRKDPAAVACTPAAALETLQTVLAGEQAVANGATVAVGDL